MEIYFSNLNSATTKQQLMQRCADYGASHCSSIRTICNADKSRMNTYAYVSVGDQPAAQACVDDLDNSTFEGNIIHAKLAN